MLIKTYKNISCSNCQSKSHSLIENLNSEELNELEKNRGCSFYKKSDYLLWKGSVDISLFDLVGAQCVFVIHLFEVFNI